MDEKEVVGLFETVISEVRCPECNGPLTGGYYNPEELVKGPSDGIIPIKIPIDVALGLSDPGAHGLALYVECEGFNETCRFREVFGTFYRAYKKEKEA